MIHTVLIQKHGKPSLNIIRTAPNHIRSLRKPGASVPCSFENLSSRNGALVIDLTPMAGVTVNVAANTATVQMGARHGNMYHAITTAGRAVGRSNLTSLGGVWTQVSASFKNDLILCTRRIGFQLCLPNINEGM
jgi:hypothetical protein